MPLKFIAPATPAWRAAPPSGKHWLHEVKFDGWRIQLLKERNKVAVFSRNGYDYTRRLPAIAAALAGLPFRSAIIDGELCACDQRGRPDFRALHFRAADDDELCVWAFDLMYLDGADLREQALVARKHALEKLVYKTRYNWLRLSESFDDGMRLLIAADRMGLEGVVSKQRDAAYRSGNRCDWIKAKCSSWREANRERWRLFER